VHLIRDYITLSEWMATENAKGFAPAAVHALVYSLRCLTFRCSLAAQSVIHGEQAYEGNLNFADYNGSILSGPELGGVSKTRMIFRCGTEITTILSLS